MIDITGVAGPRMVAMVSGIALLVRMRPWGRMAAMPRHAGRGGRDVQRSEQDREQRRGREHQQERASVQQVISAPILRPPSVGLVTEM